MEIELLTGRLLEYNKCVCDHHECDYYCSSDCELSEQCYCSEYDIIVSVTAPDESYKLPFSPNLTTFNVLIINNYDEIIHRFSIAATMSEYKNKVHADIAKMYLSCPSNFSNRKFKASHKPMSYIYQFWECVRVLTAVSKPIISDNPHISRRKKNKKGK